MPRVGSADWFDLQVTVSIDGEEVPFDELFVALARGEEYLILETGVYFGLDRPEFAALRDLIVESQALVDHPRPELSINRFQTSLWEDLVNLGSEIDQSVRWNRAVQGLTGSEVVEPVAAPSTLRAELRPYQLDGFRWLNFLWTHQLGGILADDMGLGKTLQALALICRVNASPSRVAALPGGRADQRGVQLGERGRPVRSRSDAPSAWPSRPASAAARSARWWPGPTW